MARLQSRQISQLHLYQVLHAVRVSGQPISRAQIGEATGLSQAATSTLTRRLIDLGAIMEVGARPSQGGGRREREFALNPDYAWVIGVKVALHQITLSLVDFTGGVRNVTKVDVKLPLSHDELVSMLAEQIGCTLANAPAAVGNRLSGVGIAIPGFIDSIEGEVHWSPVLKSSDQPVPLSALLSRQLNVPVFIENDANILALAEQWFGEVAGLSDVAVITLEHGLGLGLVLDGELHRGRSGMAGELAHVQVDLDGPPCRCGKRGCLETLVNHDALVRQAMVLGILEPVDRPLSFQETHQLFSRLIERARIGDSQAQAIFSRHGRLLGLWIGNIVNLFAPQTVVLDGGGMSASDLFEDTLRSSMNQAVLKPHRDRIQLLLKHRGDETWARGAASLVLQRLDNTTPIIASITRHNVEFEDVGGRSDA